MQLRFAVKGVASLAFGNQLSFSAGSQSVFCEGKGMWGVKTF